MEGILIGMEHSMDTTETIGDRIKIRRKLRGLSIRQAAELGGVDYSHWSRIEKGTRGADNRNILAGMAVALRCSVADLTGTASVPLTSETAALVGDVNDVLAALVETDLRDEATCDPVPLDRLTAEAALLENLYGKGDFTAVAARLAPFLRQVHAATVASKTAEETSKALRLTVMGSHRTMHVLRNVGERAEAYLAGERARDAAEELDDPTMKGIAAYTRAQAALGCGSMERGLKTADAGLRFMDGHLLDTAAQAVAGQLHLTAAMTAYGLKRAGDGDGHLDEAVALAERTGDTGLDTFWFGPTNLAFWKLAIEVDAGDPGKAVEIAKATNPMAIQAPTRQAMFYLDFARALARIGTAESDAAAVRMLTTAERIVPQRVRNNPIASETLRMIVLRTKARALDAQTRGLAERLGITT